MRPLILALGFGAAFLSHAALAQGTYHRGYTRDNGTYVQPHYQTAPNSTRMDNWSTQGNVNPHTGREGTVNPYASPPSSYSYGSNPYGSRSR